MLFSYSAKNSHNCEIKLSGSNSNCAFFAKFCSKTTSFGDAPHKKCFCQISLNTTHNLWFLASSSVFLLQTGVHRQIFTKSTLRAVSHWHGYLRQVFASGHSCYIVNASKYSYGKCYSVFDNVMMFVIFSFSPEMTNWHRRRLCLLLILLKCRDVS